MVPALLSARAKVDLQTKDGVSPLHVACQRGPMEVVRALLSGGAGVKVSMQTEDGVSPLHTACQQGHIGVVRALLSAGARADLRDIDGRTPLVVVPRALHAEVERLVQQAKEERGRVSADESGGILSSCSCAAPTPLPVSQPAAGSQRRWRWRLL